MMQQLAFQMQCTQHKRQGQLVLMQLFSSIHLSTNWTTNFQGNQYPPMCTAVEEAEDRLCPGYLLRSKVQIRVDQLHNFWSSSLPLKGAGSIGRPAAARRLLGPCHLSLQQAVTRCQSIKERAIKNIVYGFIEGSKNMVLNLVFLLYAYSS